MSKRLAECQRVIGYHFANPQLLEIALTHSSVRTPDRECNERQEFLGDSVLGLAITEELYKRLPDQQEGELTRIKSAVVSRGALYRVSTRLGLPRFVEVAKGVVRRDELPVSLTANLVESIIGAIYLDAGFFPAREFILRFLGPEVEDVLNDRVPKNYKSLLQHEAQQLLGVTPVYRTLEEEGPDHRKLFTVAALVKGREYGRASGVNKREAEQESARKALEALQRGARQGRRRRGPAGPPRLREREEVRHRPASDEDAWKAWAESGGEAPTPAPSGPYVIGPESDEGWSEAPSGSAESDSFASSAEEASRPHEGETGRPAAPEAGSAEEGASAPAEEAPGRRRRGGRRGGRRRRAGEEPAAGARADGAPSAEPAGEGSGAHPPESPAADSAGSDAPASGASAAPERPTEGGRPARPGPRERLARYRAPKTRREEPASPAPGASPPPDSGFGQGVLGGDAAPAPAPKREKPPVAPVGEVPAVRKAPKPPKPAAGGGFGEGI